MVGFDIFIFVIMGLFGIMIPLLFVIKKRQDANEPLFGWKRKQYLQEVEGGEVVDGPNKSNKKKDKNKESLKDLIGVEDVWLGIFEKSKNEFCVILEADSVNFDLLNDAARGSIIIGYQALFRSIRFPIQVLGQAVRQDLRKDEQRFRKNLQNVNQYARDYNEKVIQHVKERSEREFRISRRVYYVVPYMYETSKLGQLNAEQRKKKIAQELYGRASIVARVLQRAKIECHLLDSLEAIEVLKRALNRDRMLANPIESIEKDEKITGYITADPETLPGLDDLLNVEIEEVFESGVSFTQRKGNEQAETTAEEEKQEAVVW
jgi:hypothetical protein